MYDGCYGSSVAKYPHVYRAREESWTGVVWETLIGLLQRAALLEMKTD